MNIRKKAAVGYTILVLGVAWGLGEVKNVVNHTASSSHKSCVVQDRGLKAQHYLTESLGNIRELLTPDLSEKRPAATPRIQLIVDNLNENLDLYLLVEKNQPSGRTC